MPANLTSARDLPIGSTLYDSGWVDASTGAQFYCTGGETWTYGYNAAMTPVPAAGAGVYQTTVPGIGVRVGWSDMNLGRPADITQSRIMNWPRNSRALESYAVNYGFSSSYRVQFIKTGNIGSGNISSPSAFSYNGIINTQLKFSSLSIPVAAAGCSITGSGNITVNLPNARAQNFGGVGSTQGATAFSIPLVCDAGVSVAYKLDGPADPSNAPGVLANQTGSGKATGVGVQVLQGSAPVTLGAVSPTFIQTTQANQAVSIPMTAQYYKTNSVVNSGSVSAIATLTMNYQ
ncbi:fimbrial protein [Cupriavidus yeoncheonensis]|nr:fimbrial protein [Cupriavidus yeoncheonensis]